jgi:hypothetical protein
MSASRTLLRKIDPDAVARVLAGIRGKPAEPLKKVKPPRKADTYRANSRNAVRARRAARLAARRA